MVLKKSIWFSLIPYGNQKVYIVLPVTNFKMKPDLNKMAKEKQKINPPELKEAEQKVMTWFFSYPTKEFGLNELAEELGISKTSANKAVMNLAREGFLRRETLGKMWRISCNQQHGYNLTLKIGYNLVLIYHEYTRWIADAIHKLISNPKAIILFGSYRRGDSMEESDVDIAVEILGNKEIEIIELSKIAKLGYRKNVPVRLHIFSRNKIDLNLFANIANGIILEGFLEVKP